MDIERPSIDYVNLAQSMGGVPAARVERAADIAPTVEAGIASDNANLVEVITSAS
jgi:benzoylformate decarboxylase